MSITRVLSALVLVAVVGGTIVFCPPWATAVLAAIVAVAASVELLGFARPAGALTGSSGSIGQPPGPVMIVLLIPVYVVLPLAALAWIRMENGNAAVVWLIAVIAASDTAQYYVGTKLGRRKLAPAISPGKTIEGAIGGLVVAPIVGGLAARWWLGDVTPVSAAGWALVLSAVGMAGDLFESYLKRRAGLKDSSSLIPGHGGVLDRIDSYLFAAPVYYAFLRYAA